MIVNVAVQELLNCKPGDEILVANKDQYYNGAPIDEYGNSMLYKKVVDIVKDNNKLVILVK